MTLENSSTGKQILGTVLLFSFVMFCLQKVLAGKPIIEGFLQFPMAPRSDVVGVHGSSLPGNNQMAMAPPSFTVQGTYQSPLSPRLSSTGLGANINYNIPALANLALDPQNPRLLSPGDYAKAVENNILKEDPSPPSKENFKYPPDSSSAAAQNLMQQMQNEGTVVEAALALPLNTMASSTAGGSKVPLQMNRFIVAPLKSRLFRHADFIRGDIAVVPVNPNSNPNSCTWFRPSVNPSVDLNPGALAVMGGAYGEQARSVAQLQQTASGGARTTASGVAWEPSPDTVVGQYMVDQASMASQKRSMSTQNAPYGDINVESPSSAPNNAIPRQPLFTLFP